MHLVAFMLCTLLFLCFILVLPYFYHITPCYFHALLHLYVMPCSSCVVPYYFCSCTLLLSFSCLVIRAILLFAPCCPAIAPCYSTLLVVGPCCPTIVPCYSPFSSTFSPLTPLFLWCLVVHYHTLLLYLVLYLVCWYSILTFLCRWRNLEQHQQASSNNKGIFFYIS
jgi:hypothetical protein